MAQTPRKQVTVKKTTTAVKAVASQPLGGAAAKGPGGKAPRKSVAGTAGKGPRKSTGGGARRALISLSASLMVATASLGVGLARWSASLP